MIQLIYYQIITIPINKKNIFHNIKNIYKFLILNQIIIIRIIINPLIKFKILIKIMENYSILIHLNYKIILKKIIYHLIP
jgi:hypothetical protein